MTKPRRRTCPDCPDQILVPIQVIDLAVGNDAIGLMFTHAGEKRSPWTDWKSHKKGTAHALLCEDCGRVLWYAMSEAEANAMFAREAAERDAAGGRLALTDTRTGSLTLDED